MDLKELLKNILIITLSILFFIGLTFLSKWIGIEKEFFIFLCIIGIISSISGLLYFTWGRARRQGIEKIWYLIFSIILIYGILILIFQIYEILFLDIEWYISISIALSPIVFMSIAYLIYKYTAIDNVKAGVLAFLLSMFSGQTIAIQADKTIAREISENPKTVQLVIKIIDNTPLINKIVRSSTQIGKLGEYITNRMLTFQGYTKIASKYKGNQGIDHIFVKYKNGNISKIQIVESKVNTSQLRIDQMSDKGILERIERLLSKKDITNEEKAVYEFIKNNINSNHVVKQLYNHNYHNNFTTIYKLGTNQEIIQKSSFYNKIIPEVFNGIKG